MALCTLPKKPKHAGLSDAYSVLERSIDSAESFFGAFENVRKARNAVGAPTDHEQDLLRAALLFATAGLDAMVKQLVRDALGAVLEKNEGAQQMFVDHVRSRVSRSPLDVKYLADVLTSQNPRDRLKMVLLEELTATSLQSKDQLLKVAAHFAIPAAEICADLGSLKRVFDARNEIAHEMDILFGQPNRGRRSRKHKTMHDDTKFVLQVSCAFYSSVEKRL